ncbi:MAG TPA: peptidase [Prolixibacteraceae bacterium]|nr:peptidase [Prolixibacteraceae bacterium]
MKTTIFATLLITFSVLQAIAQNFDKAKLDAYFDSLEKNDKFMGSVAVSQNGEIIYTRSVGFADVENQLIANTDSKYRIGSISKTFTTVLVMKAVEEKKLDLNQTIDKFFPEIKNAGKITVVNLLYHRSGIHSFTDDKEYLEWNTQPKTEKELLEIIIKGGSDFEPNSKSVYSNSNFVLLTFILEKSFGKPYKVLVDELIAKPAGLKNTAFGGKIDTGKNECKSYKYLGQWNVEPETDISVPLGAGGIVSTPSDLIKFSDALFDGKLVSKESLEQMQLVKERYGMGLFPIPFYDKTGYGHTGGIDGFTSVFSHFADGNISYALTSNGTNFNNNNISIAVLSAVFGKDLEIPEFKTFKVDAATLEKYVGVYASTQIPLKITITRNNETLVAQATGQSAFPLEATAADKFKFDQAGVVMEFNATDNSMVLKQGGGVFNYKKE